MYIVSLRTWAQGSRRYAITMGVMSRAMRSFKNLRSIAQSRLIVKKQAAVKSLVDMLEAGMIDEEAALQALKNVKG